MNIRSEKDFLKEIRGKGYPVDENAVFDCQKSKGLSFVEAVRGLNILNDMELLGMLSGFFGIKAYFAEDDFSIDESVISKLSAKHAGRYNAIPVSFDGTYLEICISDPFDVHMIDDISVLAGVPVKIAVSLPEIIAGVIRKYYGVGAGILDDGDSIDSASEYSMKYEEIDKTADSEVANFVNELLLNACARKCTDIHIEPYAGDIAVRYRIDGILHDITVPSGIKKYQSNLITRVKLMAGLDIAEKRLPQDGRIKISVGTEMLDLRVSTLPTPFGESVNIRILSSLELLELDKLGLSGSIVENLKKSLNRDYGMFLVTGPTGSGKTTTLYSILSYLDNREKKIITIEDPIEYQIRGITQIQTHSEIGLDFARGLRSVLRHDPDIIMVGEIRDSETASIAVRSALTGHLLLSTLHTNDAASAPVRLIDMGIEPYIAASALIAVMSQRLIRVLCDNCKKGYLLEDGVEIAGNRFENIRGYAPAGCARCASTGYKGRVPAAEIMVLDETVRHLIASCENSSVIRDCAVNSGMKLLVLDAFDKFSAGVTSIDEVMRIG